jgi:Uma2 family endonuclease
MAAIVLEEKSVIPPWIEDNESFCRWALSGKYPERGRVSFFNDKVWVDLSMESEIHNWIKNAFVAVLSAFVSAKSMGRYYSDGMMMSSADAELATEPDGMFVSTARRKSGRVAVRGGKAGSGRAVIITGSPDMVLEVVSPSSVRKDTIELVDLYWKAGVSEYWLVDPRTEDVRFTLYARSADGYRAVRQRHGWRKSAVFGAEFRLVQSIDDADKLPTFLLEVR